MIEEVQLELARQIIFQKLQEAVGQQIKELGPGHAAIVSPAAIRVTKITSSERKTDESREWVLEIHYEFNPEGLVFVEGIEG